MMSEQSEATFRKDVLAALEPNHDGVSAWTDHQLLWMYTKWRVAGLSHDQIIRWLESCRVSSGASPEQGQILSKGIALLDRPSRKTARRKAEPELSRTEIEIAGKLAASEPVYADQRQRLPEERIRFRAIVEAVSRALLQRPCFPPHEHPMRRSAGVVIEARSDGSYVAHQRIETGMASVSEPMTIRAESLEDAVRFFLFDIGATELSGIRIDWEG